MSRVKRVRKYLVPIFLIVILAISALAFDVFYINHDQAQSKPMPYVGVAFGGNTTQEAKLLIDKISGYTNLFILDSGRNPISRNQSSVEEICSYAVSKGLSVIVNLGIDDVLESNEKTWFWDQPLNSTKQRWTDMWGDKFLGVYYNDEPAGIQLDGNWSAWYEHWAPLLSQMGTNTSTPYYVIVQDLQKIYSNMLNAMSNDTKPLDYDLEEKFFVDDVLKLDPGLRALNANGITAYTSDYSLYWFDYLGGYNTLFAELGSNNSVSEEIAQVKGAARLENKDWGTMITWKYNQTPYLDSGDQIYNQMLTSYEAGAKYITVFDYPYDQGNEYGTMTNDQFNAMQRFWNDVTQKKFTDLSSPEAVLVLPKNFGWGMRQPNDTIWGFWTSDYRTQQTATITSKLLVQYGARLDIVYDDAAYPVTKIGYKSIYYWNSTVS
jgi:hypothetical protein